MTETNLAVNSAFPPATISTRLAQNLNPIADLERNLIRFHRRVIVLGFAVAEHLHIGYEG